MKKINCKHDLTKEQEIRARRLRVALENQSPEAIDRVRTLKQKWIKTNQSDFVDFLFKEDIVCYSAVQRIQLDKRMQILSVV